MNNSDNGASVDFSQLDQFEGFKNFPMFKNLFDNIKNSMINDWRKRVDLHHHSDINSTFCDLKGSFLTESINLNASVYEHFHMVAELPINKIKNLENFINSLNLDYLYFFKNLHGDSIETHYIYGSTDCLLKYHNTIYSSEETGLAGLSLCTNNKDLYEKFIEFCNTEIPKKDEFINADINIVVQGNGGLTLRNVGSKLSKELERQNYSEKVVKEYDYVVNQFASKDPYGRLAILHGTPGTGKTRMICGLVHALTKTKNQVIFLDAQLLSTMSSASLLSLFTSSYTPVSSILLIIEDADSCLVKRGIDNMNTIATVLNLTDGIIGSALDIRIIATTNADKVELDEGIGRSGRLLKIIEVGKLDAFEANDIYKRLSGNKEAAPFSEPTKLADVYELHYKDSADVESSGTVKKRPAGFRM